MPDTLAHPRLLFYGAVIAYVLAGAWSIDHAGPGVAWAVGTAGALGLGLIGRWLTRSP